MTKQKLVHLVLLIFFAVTVIFAVHYIFPSMLNYRTAGVSIFNYGERIDHNFFELEVYNYHVSLPAFARRPTTSFLINLAHERFHLSYGNSFILINFGLLLLSGFILYLLSQSWGSSHQEALFSVALFYISFTILFAFFISIYTYDEPLQYLAIFLAMLFATKRRWLLFGVALFFALLTRESTIFLLPGFIILFAYKKISWKKLLDAKNFNISAIVVLLTLGVYLAVLFLFLRSLGLVGVSSDYFLNTRFGHWAFNFQDGQHALESIVSIILAVGWQFFVLIEHGRARNLTDRDKRIALAVLITFVISTPILLVATRVREARLLALPLVILLPLLGRYALFVFRSFRQRLGEYAVIWKKLELSSKLWLIAIIMFGIFSFGVYAPTASGNFDWGYQGYLMLTLDLVLIYYYLHFVKSISAEKP
jgi:hypothetical protein